MPGVARVVREKQLLGDAGRQAGTRPFPLSGEARDAVTIIRRLHGGTLRVFQVGYMHLNIHTLTLRPVLADS